MNVGYAQGCQMEVLHQRIDLVCYPPGNHNMADGHIQMGGRLARIYLGHIRMHVKEMFLLEIV